MYDVYTPHFLFLLVLLAFIPCQCIARATLRIGRVLKVKHEVVAVGIFHKHYRVFRILAVTYFTGRAVIACHTLVHRVGIRLLVVEDIHQLLELAAVLCHKKYISFINALLAVGVGVGFLGG